MSHRSWARTVTTYLGILGCTVAASAIMAPGAQAAPTLFGTNAYDFVFVGTGSTFANASTGAAASSFNGVDGHLATITSQAENDFLIGLIPVLFSGFNGAWLGGDAQGWLEGPESGQTFAQAGGYTNWNPVEPNNNGLMYMSIGTSTPNAVFPNGPGNWLDDSGVQGVPSGADPVIGYFIEYENVNVVPAPGIFGILSFGLVLLSTRGRNRRARLAAR